MLLPTDEDGGRGSSRPVVAVTGECLSWRLHLGGLYWRQSVTLRCGEGAGRCITDRGMPVPAGEVAESDDSFSWRDSFECVGGRTHDPIARTAQRLDQHGNRPSRSDASDGLDGERLLVPIVGNR